ncbi:helix-turn-helix domain-containing protein [Okeania sp. KiyG1]|uniref:helix-turn-helix domain-containing protein n=1 Tax=Okeania sp. KiyG1 TaxID=2720165 RepID=UPI0019C4C00A|nr:hypothetical protein CYANOKiyG1_10720 [Okeania sp. KiyG1]
MKARFKYRIYPKPGQEYRLAKLFGCVRVVWNDSLACCQQKYKSGEKKPTNSQLQKQFITKAKKAEDREWLSEVSTHPSAPLPGGWGWVQSLNDLNQAYQNFFKSTKGQRKGKPVKPPKFKSRKSKQTAKFTLMRF